MAVGPAGLPLPAVAPTASPAPRTCVDEGARRAVVDRGRQRSTLRPHPPIEGYCERRRFEETPQRLRAIHRGIAQALARRGRVAEALRHAAEARDTALLGRFAESTGGVRLWLEQDLEGLRTVDGLLTAEVLSPARERRAARSRSRSSSWQAYSNRWPGATPRPGWSDEIVKRTDHGRAKRTGSVIVAS